MAVTAQTIISRVRTQLIDELPTKRWTDDELLRWLSDAQRTVVAIKPSQGLVQTSIQLVPGTMQTLPPGMFLLLDIQRNLGLDGNTPGRAVTQISRENLDRVEPNWHASLRSDVTLHYLYDTKQPLVFFVYPPSTGQNWLDLNYAQTPPDFTALTDPMTIEVLYQTALFDYVMFRAHQKDSDYSAGESKAQVYLALFQMFVGVHEGAKVEDAPPDPDRGAVA
jgi:hypothetical protein